jgi:energy-coupling factor transport system ATP-binding protein
VQLLNGILKPTSGDILVDGHNIFDKGTDIQAIRFKIGLVMQYPEYQLFDETVGDDIAFGPKNMKLDKDEIEKRVYEAAEFSGLSRDLLKKSPFELSGGQKRRAALAGVISMKPELLVLDEPAAGLDPMGRREILGRIADYRTEGKRSVVIVSHSMEDMAKYCDRIVVMCAGRIVMDGTPSEVFERSSELLAIGLDIPQITRVAASLADRGVDIGFDVYTVKYALRRLAPYFGISEDEAEAVIKRMKK